MATQRQRALTLGPVDAADPRDSAVAVVSSPCGHDVVNVPNSRAHPVLWNATISTPDSRALAHATGSVEGFFQHMQHQYGKAAAEQQISNRPIQESNMLEALVSLKSAAGDCAAYTL